MNYKTDYLLVNKITKQINYELTKKQSLVGLALY
jgi:hypothetical protein